MILSQPEIRAEVEKGQIRFDPPLEERQWHMHQTAPWLQPGWNGQITLEIRNSGPFLIELTPTEDMPCQVTFFQLTSELAETVAYGARPTDVFQGQASPLPPTIDQHL